MKKLAFFYFMAFLFLNIHLKAQAPEGPFKIVEAQYGEKAMTREEISKQSIIKIFKDGFWIAAFFGKPDQPFNGTGGGTFEIKNGKYVESLKFYSWDSTAVGEVYTFDYKLSGKNYWQEGKINSDKYKDFPIKEKFEKIPFKEKLEDASLEGVWQMQAGNWGSSKLGEGQYKDVSVIKVFAYPRFAFAYYNENTKGFTGAGGGTYQFDGKTLTEYIEYWSWGKPKYPKSVFEVTISNDSYTQAGWDNNLQESWKKSHHQ